MTPAMIHSDELLHTVKLSVFHRIVEQPSTNILVLSRNKPHGCKFTPSSVFSNLQEMN